MAQDASWKAPFCIPTSAEVSFASTQGPLTKNLTIWFGAHRASVYGTTTAAETMALTTAAKNHARESHAREHTGRQVCPKTLDEEF